MDGRGNVRRYNQWKSSVPGLYDWLTIEDLVWPSLCCRWGSQVTQAMCWTWQQLYFSERTDGSSPNTLVISDVRVMRERSLKKAKHKIESIERSFVTKRKIIIHPGEVNRIREVRSNTNIVATHTDSPDVLIWNVETQSDREPVLGARPSRPDLVLMIGHQDIADFALATCLSEPLVLSGGKDKSVVLWSLEDHVSSLAANHRPTEGTTVGARGVFRGHEDTVEDVHFNKSSAQEFCSVGDDSCLILWDARTGYAPVVKVEKAHNADVHCVNWNPNDVNLILTGSADNTVRMYDRRKLTSRSRRVGAPVHIFDDHSAAVMCVEWSPTKESLFGSAAEDGFVNIWDHAQAGNLIESGTSSDSPALLFKHEGHSPYKGKVVDFQWNPASPLTIASVAENGKRTGGGTLQIWRMSDIFWPREVI